MATIIVFYCTDGAAAKQRAREILAERHHARVYDVGAWDQTNDHCDAVWIMPDVPEWQVKRIISVYGDKIISGEFQPEEKEVAADSGNVVDTASNGDNEKKEENEGSEQLTTTEQTDGSENQVEHVDPVKRAVHKGGGRWFVMKGNQKVSGPHNKDEAKQLAAL